MSTVAPALTLLQRGTVCFLIATTGYGMVQIGNQAMDLKRMARQFEVDNGLDKSEDERKKVSGNPFKISFNGK